MLAAITAHENVHATRFRPALVHATVTGVLRTTIEGLSVPDAPGMTEAMAIAAIQALPAFATALTTAQANWLAQILVLVAGDHAGGAGPTYVAERAVLQPMIDAICLHAKGNGWGPCPVCPP